MPDPVSSNSARQSPFPATREKGLGRAILASITGFLAVMLLGIGLLFLVLRGANVNLDFGFDLAGKTRHLMLHRLSLGGLLFGTGAWFALLTRGVWQRKRYAKTMGWITLAVAVAIAILLAVS